jgi:small subunit ribosomal protein S16
VLRIRLRRVGLKKQPSYRMVIAENEWPRDGRFLEIVGRYNPRTNPETVEVNEERMYHWLKNGAQPTESMAQLPGPLRARAARRRPASGAGRGADRGRDRPRQYAAPHPVRYCRGEEQEEPEDRAEEEVTRRLFKSMRNAPSVGHAVRVPLVRLFLKKGAT